MNDDEIRQLFEGDEARPPQPGYWGEIRARLEAVDAERSAPIQTPPGERTEISENPDTDVVLLRPSTMNINDYPRNTQRLLFLAAAAVLVVAVVGVGVILRPFGSGTNEVASDETTDQTDTAIESTTSTTTGDDDTFTTVEADSPELVNEAEGDIRFDYGIIERMEEIDGTVWIWFDRVGFGPDQVTGPDHQAEPRYELASDWHGGENVNPRLRTFPLANDAEVLLLNPAVIEVVCGGGRTDEESYDVFVPQNVIAEGFESLAASLTFNDSGEVSLVRDQTNC